MARNMMKKRVLKLQFNAPLILLFSLASLAVLIADHYTGGAGEALGDSTVRFFSVYRSSWADPAAYIRLFGHVLGHADWNHYLGNIMLLLVVGPPLEEKYGSWTLLWAMCVTAVVSGLAFILWNGSGLLLGASGIVFMCIMLSSLAGMRDGAIPITLILVAILYLGGELWAAFTGNDSVSQLTHIIGGLCGTVIGFILARRRR